MSFTSALRRGAVALLAVTALVAAPSVTPAEAQTSSSLGAGGEYFPLTPTRIFDQFRNSNSTFTVPVAGRGGVPSSGVLAVGINVTVDRTQGSGYLAVSPSDFQRGANEAPSSLLNFNGRNDTVPNFGIVGVGPDGIKIELVTNGGGNTRVIVDVFGFVATSSFTGGNGVSVNDGARLVAVTPERIVDTRRITGSPRTNGGNPLSARQNLRIPVRGVAPVPNDSDVSAVVVNLTGINTTSSSTTTYLSAGPSGVPSSQAEASSSNGNYDRDSIQANLAIVPLASDGSFTLFNRAGRIDVAIDVVGYLEENVSQTSTRGRIVPLEAPFRSFDTREPEFDNVKLGRQQWEDWSFEDFANSVQLDGQAVGSQSALFGNLTVTQFARFSSAESRENYMTLNPAYPDGQYPQGDAPNSNINVREGSDVANAAIVTYGSKGGDDYMISAFNRWGSTHYLLDVSAVILS
ncbi:MAG: hypothetical protein AB8G26_00895 [Ilumatobacter sp.]